MAKHANRHDTLPPRQPPADSIPVEHDSPIGLVQVPRFERFPVEVFPKPVREFVVALAKSSNHNVSAVALPVLSVLASAVGGRWWIQLKNSWSEPAALWTALLTNGQVSYDAVLNAVTRPLQDRQARSAMEQAARKPLFQQQMAQYRALRRKYQGEGPEPVRPVEPVTDLHVTADWSRSAVTRRLSRQSRAPLVCSWELDGWIGKSAGGGSRAMLDRQLWFDLHESRPLVVEARGNTPEQYLPQASISLTGLLSEQAMSAKLWQASGTNGLANRVLFAYPPMRHFEWTEDDVQTCQVDAYAQVVDQLFQLPDPGERRVALTDEARQTFREFLGELKSRHQDIDSALYAWGENLARQAARLALVLHLSRWAAGESVDTGVCDAVSLQGGITLARWFANEAQRVVTVLSLTEKRRWQQDVIDWMLRQQRPISARDLCRSNSRRYPTLEAAVEMMATLREIGATKDVEPTPGPQGGRPKAASEVARPTVPAAPGTDPGEWQEEPVEVSSGAQATDVNTGAANEAARPVEQPSLAVDACCEYGDEASKEGLPWARQTAS